MAERTGLVTRGGNPVTLLGNDLKVGDPAPDFALVGADMSLVKLSDYRGKVVIVAAVPSLETVVCSNETVRFEEEAESLGDDVAIITVSMDLPYAMKRWATENAIEHVVLASDHQAAAFGEAYGVLRADMRLLARAVYVIDRQGVVRYIQIVPEIGQEPDYAEVIQAAQRLI
ncbi:MAG: thiol peroxidase [Anaerolineae bacterium]